MTNAYDEPLIATKQKLPPQVQDGRYIQIPAQSLTAFRLKYCSPQEISRASETLLLGGLPESWIASRSTFFKLSHRARFKRKFKNINARLTAINDQYHIDSNIGSPGLSDSVTFTDSCVSSSGSGHSPMAIQDGSFKSARSSFLTHSSTTDELSVTEAITNTSDTQNMKVLQLPSAQVSANDSLDGDPTPKDYLGATTNSEIISLYNKIHNGQKQKASMYTSHDPQIVDFGLKQKQNQNSQQQAVISDTSSFENFQKLEPVRTTFLVKILKHDSLTPSIDSIDDSIAQENNALPRLTFAETPYRRSRQGRESIKNLVPNPINESGVFGSPVPVNSMHWKMFDKLKKGARTSRLRVAYELEEIENRLRISRFLRSYKIGEIVKMEKMLVLVKKARYLCMNGALKDEEAFDTRVSERWKEFIVVARSNTDLDCPIFLQFKTKRSISNSEQYNPHGIDCLLNIHKTSITFYSSLDKSISVGVPNEKEGGNIYYIMKTHTASSATSWFRFLTDCTTHKTNNSIPVELPDLKMRIDVRIPWEILEEESDTDAADESLQLFYNINGYTISRQKGLRYLIELVDVKLRSSRAFAREAKSWSELKDKVLPCWRTFDRLEWLPNAEHSFLGNLNSMGMPQVLELRQLAHRLKEVVTPEGFTLNEPTPIEGFLARLTSYAGRARSGALFRQVFKLEYFYTHENYLMYCAGRNGIPPLPDTTLVDLDGAVSGLRRLRNELKDLPQEYLNNKYSLDSRNHIQWLHPNMTDLEFRKYDLAALYELERRSSQIIQARGVIDVCQIKDIVSVPDESISKAVKVASSVVWSGSIMSAADSEFSDSCFEIHLFSGGVMRIQAPSNLIKNQWVLRLSELCSYWKLRKRKDEHDLIRFKDINLKRLNAYDAEGLELSTKQLWEYLRAFSDPSIYNVSDVALTTCVLMSGKLYQKPKKHSNFNQFFAVLSPGNLVLFQMSRRSHSGIIKKSSGYRHFLTLNINEAYVYSGTCSELDLVDKERGIDHIYPTDLSQPRVYDDGWISSEKQKDRCFTLWFGAKRAIAGDTNGTKIASVLERSHGSAEHENDNSRPRSANMNPGFIRLVSRLGVTGKSVQFVTRSRQERDLWVSRISNSAESFLNSEEFEEIVA